MGLLLNVSAPDLPGGSLGLSKESNVNSSEFGPLEVRAVCIEGVLFPLVLESESFSAGSCIVDRVDSDVLRDIRSSSNLFGDVMGEEVGIGIGGRRKGCILIELGEWYPDRSP